MTSPKTRVVVIGGGLAGIYAARTLHELTGDAKRVNVEVILVEAQDTLGGRIQPIPDHHFRSLPPGKRLEIGAEFLHGDGSLFNHYAESVLKMDTRLAFDFEVLSTGKSRHQQSFLLHYQGCMHAPGDHHDLVQLNNALELLSEPYEVQRQNKVLERILDSEGDISVGQYLREMGIPERTMGIADALFSKTAGTSLDVNGLKDTVLEQQQWVYGSRNYQFYRDYSRSLVHYLAQDLTGVRLNWPVQSVEYGAKGNITVRRKGSHDVIDNVDFVIVAVPLSILRNRDISFTPELPPYKQQAIQCLEMHGGIKTICMFKHQFWKPKFSNLRLIIIGDDPIYSQCWMPAVQERSDWKERPAVVTGFLTGDKANEITERMKRGEIDEQWMIERFMECLDNIFKPELGSDFSVRDLFLEGHSYNWGLNEYIQGGYSSHGIGCMNSRDQLARPVDDKFFFAGEATIVQCPATVQGAMESGARAARQVLMQHHLDKHKQILDSKDDGSGGHVIRSKL